MDPIEDTGSAALGTAQLSENDSRGHIATFAAGCFWGVERKFRDLEGVLDAEVGYSGGATVEPTYDQVCRGDTGHAEAVRVLFDPAQIGYEDLVRAFYTFHDPTTHNRQGPDVGSQYRSVIFTHGDEQAQVAREVTDELDAARFQGNIVTDLRMAEPFWRAEDYHQQYHARHGISCA